jgi:PEGA domain
VNRSRGVYLWLAMKTLLLCCCVLTLQSVAQTASTVVAKKNTATDPAAIQNLKDDFAKSSLRVLKMIERETGKMSKGQDGGYLVPRATSQAIDDLDVDAETKADQSIVSMLNDFFEAKVMDNLIISTISTMAQTALLTANLPRGPLQVSDLVAKSLTVVKIHSNEAACSSELDAALRARIYHVVAACTATALNAVIPEELDVPAQQSAAWELAHRVMTDPVLMGQFRANSNESLTSPSAAASKSWDIASAGHVLTAEELSQMVKKGQASLCLIVTTPVGADIYIDGNSSGKSPQGFTLMRHAEVPRVITIKMEGYATVEKTFVPDGQDIPLNVKLEKKHP